MVTRTQLDEIRNRYRVKPRNWLDLEIGYQGQGRATFSSNPGTIRGPVSVRYRQDGVPESFEMTVEELVAEQHPGRNAADAVFTFLHGQPIPGQPGAFGFGGFSNDCVELEVSGETFVMRSAHIIASAVPRSRRFCQLPTDASHRRVPL